MSIEKPIIVNMGNVLESDYSGSEPECDDNNGAVRRKIVEERSQGDGRESDADDVIDQLNTNVLHRAGILKSGLQNHSATAHQGSPPSQESRSDKVLSPLLKMESPKELPPKGKLIPLRPERIPKAQPSLNSHADYTSPVNKQREPKFVPYEPYAGAVKPMTDGYKKHSRKPSNSSTVSGMSTGPSQSVTAPSNSNSQVEAAGPDNTLQNHINHYKNQTHSMTLMKERLKIAERDIAELQAENARLKKLMVDSMLGSNSHMTSKGSDDAGDGINGDSLENLNDEIEVWRSKFLSSCILVDQLTKENRDMKTQISSAVQLFREIKNTAGLTASLFDQINNWLSHNASHLDYNYNASNDDFNYDLSPHPASPYS